MQHSSLVIFCNECGLANDPIAHTCAACQSPLAQTEATHALTVLDMPVSSKLPVTPKADAERSPAPRHQDSPLDFQAGTILAKRYQIEEEIGRGGFSIVYRAADLNNRKRHVAIKRIPLSVLTPEEVIGATETFNREVLMLARFKGKRGIPQFYEHLTDPENWYLVMEYIKGPTLEEFLQRRPSGYLNEEETIRVGIRLAHILQELHTDEPLVVFRDVKPANIMFTSKQELFLIDFGIARTFAVDKTKDTTPLGSPGYAAPEQYGRAQTDQRTDIYGLGATLQTLFTGRDPLELAAGEPSRNPKRPSPALRQILDEMLAPEAEQRPADMLAVQARLQAIQVSPAASAPSSYKYGLLMGAAMAFLSSLLTALRKFTWLDLLLGISIIAISLVLGVYEKWSQKKKLVGWKVFTRPAPLGILTAMLIWLLLEWLWSALGWPRL